MRIKYSLLLSLLTVLSIGSISFAQAQSTPVEIHRFTRGEDYKLQKFQGNPVFQNDIKGVERLEVVGYKNNTEFWTYDHGKNTMTFRRHRDLTDMPTTNAVKKTPDQVKQFVQTNLIAYFPIFNMSFYQQTPVAFASDSVECGMVNYSAYCEYPKSTVVVYPYLFKNLPVYHENGSVLALVVVVDDITGDIMYISGLMNNEQTTVILNASTNLKPNAYIAATRIYDEDLYLVPAVIGESVTYFFDDSFGFRATPKAPMGVKPVIVPPTPSTELKSYLVEGLKILVPQDKGIWTGESFRKLRLFHSLNVYESDVIIGKLMFIPLENRRYKELFVRRGGILLKENANGYVVLTASDYTKRPFLREVSAFFQFE